VALACERDTQRCPLSMDMLCIDILGLAHLVCDLKLRVLDLSEEWGHDPRHLVVDFPDPGGNRPADVEGVDFVGVVGSQRQLHERAVRAEYQVRHGAEVERVDAGVVDGDELLSLLPRLSSHLLPRLAD